MTPPRIFSALPPADLTKASPKAISRRTSYLRVRLEFLPYPHLIATLFNGCSFILDMGRSPGFGSALRDFPPFSDLVSLRMSASSPFSLPRVATRRTVLQKVRGCTSSCGAPAGRRHRVSGSLSLPSRGTFHLSLTVLFAIGHRVVFSLGGWSPRLPARFPVSRGTPDPARSARLPLRGFHPLRPAFPKPFRFTCLANRSP